MHRSIVLLCAAAPLALAACNPADTPPEDEANVAAEANAVLADTAGVPPKPDAAELRLVETAAPVAAGCPVESVSWSAFTQPVKGVTKLAVLGWVKLPSSGWRLELTEGPLDKMRPPTQHLRLVTSPPAGIVIPVTLPQSVSKVIDAQPEYLAVVINCGGKEIARITDIPEHPEYVTGPAPVTPEKDKL